MKVKFKYKVEFALLYGTAKLVALLGLRNTRYLAKPIALLFFYLIPIRKDVVKKNLSFAFPKLNQKEINNLAFKNYFSTAISFLEIVALPFASREEILDLVIDNQPDFFSTSQYKDNGMVLMTAHFANWELGALYVGSLFEETLCVLAKEQKNPLVARLIKDAREKLGNREILLGSSIRELYKTLKNNGYIGMVGDQRGPREGSRVKFFNRDTSIYTGTGTIAIRTNTPITVCMLSRRDDYKYNLSYDKIITENLEGSDEENEKNIIQQYMNILQSYIEKHPEQWLWMHDIWKY